MIFVSLFSKVGFQAESSYSTCKTKKWTIQANCASPQEAAMAFTNTGHPKWKNCLNSCNLYNLTKCLPCICLQQVFDFTIEITCHFKLITYPFRPRNWSYRIAISSKITKFCNLNMDNKRQRNRQIIHWITLTETFHACILKNTIRREILNTSILTKYLPTWLVQALQR